MIDGNSIDSEKAYEFQQVAALVCIDVGTLYTLSKRRDATLESLQAHIEMVHENMIKLQTDKEHRDMRYDASCMLFSMIQGQGGCVTAVE